jgi:AraC-like DNA-binding protein
VWWSGAINRVLGPLCVKAGLVARGLQFVTALLQHGVGQISDTILDGVIESLEFGLCSGRALTQVGNVRPSAFGATIEHVRQESLKTLGAAAALATSKRTLGRRMQSVLGKSPLEYFQDLRVERAVHLLAAESSRASTARSIWYPDTGHSISQVKRAFSLER